MSKKTMKGLVWAGLLIAFASGCTYHWEKPGTNKARRLQDKKECLRYAQRSYSWARSALKARREKIREGDRVFHSRDRLPSRSQEIQDTFILCLEGRGYEARWDSENPAPAPLPREGKTGSR